jgi:biotin carboxyl carrier protein
MKFDIHLSGASGKQSRTVELERDADGWRITLDGQPIQANAVQIAPNVFSILIAGQSHEIRIAQTAAGKLTLQAGSNEFSAEVLDLRAWRGRRHGAIEAEGRQEIVAPMPGKIIRLLVDAGAKVEAGQGLIVVEAMKMQNEIRSPKSGTVERIFAKEGQPVNAGEVLAWID